MKNPKHFLQQGMTLIEVSVVLLVLIALAGIATPYFGNTGRMALCQATDATLQTVKQAIMGGGAGAGFYTDMLGNYPKATKGTSTADYNLIYLFKAPTDSTWSGLTAYNINTAVGWRGPYLMSGATNNFPIDGRASDDGSLGTDGADDVVDLTNELHRSFGDSAYVHAAIMQGDQVVLDGWGRPIILQIPTDSDCGTLSTRPGGCARLISAGPIPGRDIQGNGFSVRLDDGGGLTRDDDRVLFLQIPDPKPDGNTPCDQT